MRIFQTFLVLQAFLLCTGCKLGQSSSESETESKAGRKSSDFDSVLLAQYKAALSLVTSEVRANFEQYNVNIAKVSQCQEERQRAKDSKVFGASPGLSDAECNGYVAEAQRLHSEINAGYTTIHKYNADIVALYKNIRSAAVKEQIAVVNEKNQKLSDLQGMAKSLTAYYVRFNCVNALNPATSGDKASVSECFSMMNQIRDLNPQLADAQLGVYNAQIDLNNAMNAGKSGPLQPNITQIPGNKLTCDSLVVNGETVNSGQGRVYFDSAMSGTGGWIGKGIVVQNGGQLYTNTSKPVTKIKISASSTAALKNHDGDMYMWNSDLRCK